MMMMLLLLVYCIYARCIFHSTKQSLNILLLFFSKNLFIYLFIQNLFNVVVLLRWVLTPTLYSVCMYVCIQPETEHFIQFNMYFFVCSLLLLSIQFISQFSPQNFILRYIPLFYCRLLRLWQLLVLLLLIYHRAFIRMH